MLAAFVGAALRSLILGLVVWAALCLCRIRSVDAQRYAWTAVLIGSLLMPFALIITSRWHVLNVPVPATASLDRLQPAIAQAAPASVPAASPASHPAPAIHQRLGPPRTAIATARDNRLHASTFAAPQADATAGAQPLPVRTRPSLVGLVLLAYFLVAAALLVRLLFGLVSALRLWRSSIPVKRASAAQFCPDLNVRSSSKVSAPVTIGSGIVLPAGYTHWTEEKLRIVLAHERSHVSMHDFHVQTLASLYAALAWFSPLGWWLKHKLSDLGEAISDRSGLHAAPDRSAYAQVLLEFAAAPRPTLIGVAMARNSSISRRIERLLNDSYLRHAFAAGARARAAFVLIPALLFAFFALVRVEAAGSTQDQSNAAPQMAEARAELEAAQAQMLAAKQASTAEQQAQKQAEAARALSEAQKALDAAQAELQAQQETTTKQSAAEQMLAEARAALEAAQALQAAPAALAPLASHELALATPPAPPIPPAPQDDAEGGREATFDRNLTFSDKPVLSVATGSGNITLTRGSGGQIHVHGIVKADHDANAAQVQQIAANPPITQEGGTIHIGGHQENQEAFKHISISYEIEAPADTELNAMTGSGDINDTGVGYDSKLMTGSGNIMATGLKGDFKTQTGSGNIAIDDADASDARAQTGSGNIDLKGVHGALDAQTGSGTIKAAGTPSSPWKIQAGSGTIELTTGNAPMNLDATTGSGKISSNLPVSQTSTEHNHLRGQLNGGGPEVHIQTGSGDIRIE
jgi:beta-lactamase regulating signal transducer with metallopeptidase domain